MRYYVAKGPLEEHGYQWTYSYYKVYPDNHAEAVRFYTDGRIVNNIIQSINNIFVRHYCKEITQEEYELMLEL